jgi:hypothetical protein
MIADQAKTGKKEKIIPHSHSLIINNLPSAGHFDGLLTEKKY